MSIHNLIVTGLNHYIDLDKERAVGLNQIDRKVIKLIIRELNINLDIQVQDLTLYDVSDVEGDIDVEINVSLKILPEYMLGVDRDQFIKNGDIEIIGDVHVASVFQNTMREIEIDWEELLSKYTGDAIAHHLGSGLKGVHAFARRLKDNFQLDLRDYLRDEVQVSVTRNEVDQFIHDVDSVRAKTDRLEARLNRLRT